jgi:predicted ester cyclase
MTSPLVDIYRDYLACLNDQAWDQLANFVHDLVCHNQNEIGLAGYRSMLEKNYRDIPDLHFNAQLIVATSTHVACRLHFDCSPIEKFMGLPVNGRKVQFAENVIYEFRNNKIKEVWSVIDKAAIERQLT